MAPFPVTFDPSSTKVRLGLHPCQEAEPDAADLTYFPVPSAAPTSTTITPIEDPSFQQGQKALPVAGPVTIAGDMVFSSAPDATLPLEAAGMVKASAVENLGGGAFKVLLGPSQANSTGLAFMEIDNSDPSPMAFYSIAPATLTWAVTSGGLFTLTVAPLATTASRWGLGVEAHVSPSTGRNLQVRGTPSQNFERATDVLDSTAYDLYLRCIDNSTAIPWFVAVSGRPGPITGTVEMTGDNQLVGTGTLFTTELYRGDLLTANGVVIGTVVSVESATAATMSAVATVAAGSKASREYGTAQSVGQISMGFPLRVGLDGDTLQQYATVSDSVTGAKMGRAAETGHPVEAWLFSDAGIPTPTASALTSTFTVSAGSAAITAAAGALLSEAYVGGLFTTAGGQVRRIASITDNDNAVADRNFTTSEAAVAATHTPPPTFTITGTWTYAATNTITAAADGAALTEVVAGQWLRSPTGQVARVVSVTDDDTIVLDKVMVVEASVAVSTDFEFRVPRLRSTWVPVALASGPQASTQCKVLFTITALDAAGQALGEVQQRLATSFSLPYTTGYTASVVPLGSAWGIKVSKTTVSQGQATITIEKTGKSIAELIEAKARVRVKLEVTTGKQISTSAYEYSRVLVIHGAFAGTPLQAPSADGRDETVLIDVAVPEVADAQYPDAVQLEVFTDRTDPLALTAL